MVCDQDARILKMDKIEKQLDEILDYKSLTSSLEDVLDKGNFSDDEKQQIQSVIEIFKNVQEDKHRSKLENDLNKTRIKYIEVKKRRDLKSQAKIYTGRLSILKEQVRTSTIEAERLQECLKDPAQEKDYPRYNYNFKIAQSQIEESQEEISRIEKWFADNGVSPVVSHKW